MTDRYSPIELIDAFVEGDKPPIADLRVAVLMMHTAFRDLTFGLSTLADTQASEPGQVTFDTLMADASMWLTTLEAPLRLIDTRPAVGA
jgi:hypothetical protein